MKTNTEILNKVFDEATNSLNISGGDVDSGYVDIGPLRVQWGNNAGGAVAFTVPFADTSTSVVASCQSTGNRIVAISGLSTTGFTGNPFVANTGASSVVNYYWCAIGKKP